MKTSILLPARPVVIAARRLRAIAALAVVLTIALPWLVLPAGGPARRRIAEIAWGILLAGFGIRITVTGQPDGQARLFAANHVSWLDIAVLGRLLDAGFVAKAQVGAWPVIGPLARHYGCAFIERDRRGTVAGQASTLRAHIDASRPVILFPEGTTGPGHGVLPFRSSLFAALGDAGAAMVQPVSLLYRRHDGGALSPAGMRQVAWLDDDALLPHALALAGAGGVAVTVHFDPAFTPACRKTAARHCQQVIAARLAGLPQAQAVATENRAA